MKVLSQFYSSSRAKTFVQSFLTQTVRTKSQSFHKISRETRFELISRHYAVSSTAYQSSLSLSKMKTACLLVLCLFGASQAFLQFPLSANGMLGDFLTTLEGRATINLDNAVHGEECNRKCQPNDVRICKFVFMMKYFHIMGG